MPDESQGLQEKEKPGAEASQVPLVPDITVISSSGKNKITTGKSLELDDFSQTKDRLNQSTQSNDVNVLQSGLRESQVSIDVDVVKTAQAPEPLKAHSSLRGTSMTQRAVDHDALVGSPSDWPHTDNSTSSQTNGCCDSDYSSMKSSPGYTCTSFSTDLCEEQLSELDRSSLEKTNPVSPVNFSASYSNGLDDKPSRADMNVTPKAENSSCKGSSDLPDGSSKVHQTRDSINVRWDKDDEDEDGRSSHSRRSVKEGMCCCYQAFHRAFLRCVEETPAMLSGLVLSLAFCVSIIVLIPTTERVRRRTVCVRSMLHTYIQKLVFVI